MITGLSNLAVSDDHDIICADYSIEPVRDNEQSLAPAKLGYRLLDVAFIVSVNTCGRFIEDNNWRILENASCY